MMIATDDPPAMTAVVQDRFGPPESLRLEQASQPRIGPGEVLIEVRAAAVNPYDWHMLRGDPRIARLLPDGTGRRRPRERVAGLDAAGVVRAVGPGVTQPRPGAEVLGFCPGAFAQYARAACDKVVAKPAGLTFEQAAAIPVAATTALRAIRAGQVRSGDQVLINGASGGVGTFAVQIAVAAGAEVTAVCGPLNASLMRSLGAADVIDYSARDFTADRGRYHLILDNAGGRPLRQLRRALRPDGTLLLNAGGSPGKVIGPIGPMLRAAVADRFVRQRLLFLPTTQDHAELAAVIELVESGQVRPVVSLTYPLAEVASALRLVETGHARGKVVITIS